MNASNTGTLVMLSSTLADHQVMSGGESGMGSCLREVETLAFLKVKRQEASLTHERSRFAELASWFYKRSAVGGVDHVCLVFRGGGLSLREAMSARSPPPPLTSAGGAALGSSGRPGASSAQLVWEAREVVEVARGLLEVRARRLRMCQVWLDFSRASCGRWLWRVLTTAVCGGGAGSDGGKFCPIIYVYLCVGAGCDACGADITI